MKLAPTVASKAAADGKARRASVPRASHGDWTPAADRPDPRALIDASARGRMGALLPLRNARMAESAFAFFRGSAVVMAADLDGVDPVRLAEYAVFCAYALAHAHARSGNAAAIAGYLGKGNAFDRALLSFATRYADRVEADFQAFAQTAPGLAAATTEAAETISANDVRDGANLA